MDDEKRLLAEYRAFRAGAGAVILNKSGRVLGLERKNIPGAWQCPQGGLKAKESPLEAVKREIREETGIEAGDLELLATASRLLAYELPPEMRSPKTGRGQVHYWFLFRFTGQEEAITLGDKEEFSAWQWMTIDSLMTKVVAFKQSVYEELTKEFQAYLK